MPWAVNFDNPCLRIEVIQSIKMKRKTKKILIWNPCPLHETLYTSVADSRSRFLMFCVNVSMFGSKWVLWLLFVSTKIIIQVNADSCLKVVVILRWNYPRSTLDFDINIVSHSVSQSMIHSKFDWWHWLENKLRQIQNGTISITRAVDNLVLYGIELSSYAPMCSY